ncbi:hypothetical protein NPIL_255911 [Nephila pilipes]|uniref:Uncharacterized protein n=1 Tax=Nephila pilipes TaxID=299642 RepID=A0A8X6PY09_NEPPI|nr:hypothetical protein NPIL_255911 [Nephila pilipes]
MNKLFSLLTDFAIIHQQERIAVIPCAVAEDIEHSQLKPSADVNANTTGAVTSNVKFAGRGSMLMNVTKNMTYTMRNVKSSFFEVYDAHDK